MNERNKVLVVIGPSGVGKDTIMQKVVEKYHNKFKKGYYILQEKLDQEKKKDLIIIM